MKAARWLMVAALVSFGLHVPARASEDPGELTPLPEPPLERMEPAVRKQLEQARATVDAMLGSSGASAAQRAEAFRREFAQRTLALDTGEVRSSVSIGVAQFDPGRDADGDALYHAADTALYRAKAGGRNQVRVALGELASIPAVGAA